MLANVEVTEGEEARFDATVSSTKEPKVEWFKGSQKIPDEGRFVHIDALREDVFTLVVEKIELGDAGTYTCVASSEDGEVSCSAELSVKPIPAQTESSSTNVDITEGDQVIVDVTALEAGVPGV